MIKRLKDLNLLVPKSEQPVQGLANSSTGGGVAEYQHEKPSGHSTGTDASFEQQDKDFWSVGFQGKYATVKHNVGMPVIAKLLRHPNPDLAIGVSDLCEAPVEEPEYGADPVVDYPYIKDLREAQNDLETEIDDLEKNNQDVSEELRKQQEAIKDELTNATKLGGRSTTLGSDSRTRRAKRVSEQIQRAISSISGKLPDLGSHLKKAIQPEGYSYAYRPHPPICWEVSVN